MGKNKNLPSSAQWRWDQYNSRWVKDTGSVDKQGHVQVDVRTSALPSGAATSAKQLLDNHNVTVSNPTADPETGLAKENKQLANDHDVNVSNQISGFATSAKQDTLLNRTAYQFEYMGKDTTSDVLYEYFGFKENGGEHYKVMRKELADDKAWKYAYGASGFTAAWANPQNLSYANPPN